MREDPEEKPTGARRFQEEDFGRDAAVLRPLRQSLDTLRANYSWVASFLGRHPGYEFLSFDEIPWTEMKVGLYEARVALATTAGVYVKGQKPFSISPEELTGFLQQYRFREKGDPSFRLIPATADLRDLEIAHPHLDVSGAEEDINVVYPLARLRELEEESFIGSVASEHLSFMGYLPRPQDLEAYLPEAIQHLKKDQVDVVVLTPGEVLSHQSMVVIQRALEEEGFVTVSIALCRDIVERMGTSRSVHYRFPFGYTLGDVNDEATQLRILKDTLRSVEELQEPGEVLDLPYQWVEG